MYAQRGAELRSVPGMMVTAAYGSSFTAAKAGCAPSILLQLLLILPLGSAVDVIRLVVLDVGGNSLLMRLPARDIEALVVLAEDMRRNDIAAGGRGLAGAGADTCVLLLGRPV